MENTATSRRRRPAGFTVRQLGPALGAEILGVDLRDPIDDALKQKLLDAWHEKPSKSRPLDTTNPYHLTLPAGGTWGPRCAGTEAHA